MTKRSCRSSSERRVTGNYRMARKPKRYDSKKGVRRLARERVGAVPAPKVIVPKTQRKKPKHKKPVELDEA
jgi:hypothetical protein